MRYNKHSGLPQDGVCPALAEKLGQGTRSVFYGLL